MSRLFAENLTPAEQRKLKNKLRKRAKKEALLKKEKQEEQHKKEQKAKGAADADLDGPKEEELVPDKLARVSSEHHTYSLEAMRALLCICCSILQPTIDISALVQFL